MTHLVHTVVLAHTFGRRAALSCPTLVVPPLARCGKRRGRERKREREWGGEEGREKEQK